MKTITTALLFFLINTLATQNLVAQNREYRISPLSERQEAIIQSFGLENLSNCTHIEHLRFSKHNQIVDLWRNNTGETKFQITQFIHHKRKEKLPIQDTIWIKNPIESIDSAIYNSIISHKALSLPSMENIPGWTFGKDGETIYFEIFQNNKYSVKHYWSPKNQGSRGEGASIDSLRNLITYTFKLPSEIEQLFNSLPKQGCYNFGSFYQICYNPNTIGIKSFTRSHIPLGFEISYYLAHISAKPIRLNLATSYGRAFERQKDFSLDINKNISSSLINRFSFNYKYRRSILDRSIHSQNRFTNQIMAIQYFNDKINMGFSLGYSKLDSANPKDGLHLGLSRYFTKTQITTTVLINTYPNLTDIELNLSKTFYLGQYNSVPLSTTIGYESYQGYKDVFLKVGTYF